MAMVRATALLALLAGCGGDDDDDDGGKPASDGGGMDAGGDAGRDGGMDAGSDACAVAPAGDGGAEVIDAINPPGLFLSGSRIRALAPLYCDLYTRCADAGTAEACTTSSIEDILEARDAGTSLECLDAVLNFWGCLALRDSCATNQCAAAQTRCQAAINARDQLCAPDAGSAGN